MVTASPPSDLRQHPGVALVSLRRPWMLQRLAESGMRIRHVVPMVRADGPLLGGVRPPLVLDVGGMPVPLVAALLHEVGVRQPMPVTVIGDVSRPGILRLSASVRSVVMILADTLGPPVMQAAIRVAPYTQRRPSGMPPAWVGMPPALVALPALPEMTVAWLWALAPYGATPSQSVSHVARRFGMSRRLAYYQLAALRSLLQIPNRRYRPAALAAACYQALDDLRI